MKSKIDTPLFIFRLATIISIISLCQNIAIAQNKGGLNEQIQITRDYKPVLGESYKIKKSPYFFDEKSKSPQINYTYKDLRLTKDSAHSAISPDSLRNRDSVNYPFLFIKAGAGNDHTILAEIFLNSKLNPNGLYGAWFKHFSQQGKLENQQYSKEDLNLHGKKVFNGSYIRGSLNAYEHLVYFYGYNHAQAKFNASDIKQSLKNVEAEIEFASNPDSTAGFVYSLKTLGYNFTDLFKNKEDHYQASGHIGYTVLNLLSFNLASQVLYNNQQQIEFGTGFNNSIFRIQPSITLATKVIRLKAGLNLVSDIGDNHRAQVFPDLSVDLLLDYGFNVFGGIKGDVIQNTFRDYTQKNPWLKGAYNNSPLFQSTSPTSNPFSSYNLYNTRQNFFFFAGIKGAFSKEFNYRAQVDAGIYDNLPFFINNPADNKYFAVVYDGKGTGRERLSAEFNYLPSDRFRLQAEINAVSYRLKTLAEAWHVPAIEAGIGINYNPNAQLLLHTRLNYSTKRIAQQSNLIGNTSKITLDPYTDWSLGAEYRFNRKLSIFAEGSNLLNKSYQNFLNYPVLGVQVRGGLSFSF